MFLPRVVDTIYLSISCYKTLLYNQLMKFHGMLPNKIFDLKYVLYWHLLQRGIACIIHYERKKTQSVPSYDGGHYLLVHLKLQDPTGPCLKVRTVLLFLSICV